MSGRGAALLLSIAACMFLPRGVLAHRLDEYLQATRISIERDRVRLEINLTPGAAVAEDILGRIDADHNGEISQAESLAYSVSVLRSFSLSVDGKVYPIHLTSEEIPSTAEMRRGEGIHRLYASASVPPLLPGHHQLAFSNGHRPDISVYLVNALIPEDRRIRIVDQSRDMLQREFTMDYNLTEGESGTGLAAVWPPALGLTLAAMFLVLSRRVAMKPSEVARSGHQNFGKG